MASYRRVFDVARRYLVFDGSLGALLLVSVITNLSGSLWSPLLGIYFTKNLGISIMLLGLTTTVQTLVSSLVVFPSGLLSDNIGRKKMIFLAIISSILALITLLMVRELPWIFLVSVFQGLSTAFMEPSRSAYIIDVIPHERRGMAYASLSVIQSLSGIIATSIAGVIVVSFGYFELFGISLFLEFVSLGITALYLRESLNRDAVKIRSGRGFSIGQIQNGLGMLKNPSLLAVLLGIVFHQLGLGIQNPYVSVYASDVLLFALPSVSLMLASERLGIFIGHFPSGKIVDSYGEDISFAFHIFITSPLMALYIFSGDVLAASLILFAWGLTFGLDSVSRQKLVAKYRSESGAATAFGVISLISGLTSLVSPTVGGWIWNVSSPQAVFYASAIVNVLGSLPLFLLWLYNKRRKTGEGYRQS